MYVFMHTYTHTYIYRYTNLHNTLCIYTYTHTYIHINMYAHTHTHTHDQRNANVYIVFLTDVYILCLYLSLIPSVSLPPPQSISTFPSKSLSPPILLSGPSCSLGYFPFQPVVHNWFIKGRGMYCSVYGKVHIKDPLLLIEKSSLCGGSGFPSKKCVNVTIWMTSNNRW